MRRTWPWLLAAIFVGSARAVDPGTPVPVAHFTAPQADYVLHCGGCHGLDGTSHSNLIPTLKGLAGYFLELPEGRDYLARLPNVAFSSLNDARLTALLNYVVTDLGATSTPATAKPYTPAEVARLRKQPLTEVTLSQYRRRLAQTLVAQHGAPAALLDYATN